MSDADSTAPVEYRTIARFPKAKFGSDGSVLVLKKRGWSVATKHLCPRGYELASFAEDNWKGCRRVHRLVLEAFKGPCPDGMECCHNDGSRANNCIDNLRWDTHLNNCRDRKMHGTDDQTQNLVTLYGTDNPASKFCERDIDDIWERLFRCESKRGIARKYKVSHQAIMLIARGKNWSHYTTDRILTIKALLG